MNGIRKAPPVARIYNGWHVTYADLEFVPGAQKRMSDNAGEVRVEKQTQT